jgi:hypothetical protein
MCLEQTQHILDATKMTKVQGLFLQKPIAKRFEKHILDAEYQVEVIIFIST